jgi:hypothetical protein
MAEEPQIPRQAVVIVDEQPAAVVAPEVPGLPPQEVADPRGPEPVPIHHEENLEVNVLSLHTACRLLIFAAHGDTLCDRYCG